MNYIYATNIYLVIENLNLGRRFITFLVSCILTELLFYVSKETVYREGRATLKFLSQFRNGASRVAQVVEHLLSKCEALTLNPSTTKIKVQKWYCISGFCYPIISSIELKGGENIKIKIFLLFVTNLHYNRGYNVYTLYGKLL
jgi:hypothetical protein